MVMLRADDLAAVRQAEERLVQQRAVERIWTHDPTLWKPDPADHRELADRLGWLDVAGEMQAAVPGLEAFAAEVRRDGFLDVVLLGMGGSSLGPEVFRRSVPPAPGFPRLHVLDSTVPDAVATVRRAIDPARTLFLVSSKSGTTTEVTSFYRYFAAEVEAVKGEQAGENFVAVTDPGTALAQLGAERGFRRVFINREDIGGRFSVLSYFGLVPAALLGIPLGKLLDRAQAMAAACRLPSPDGNPGLRLGAALGALARRGRDKVTVVVAPALDGFGLWVEQLLAESTGKEGSGLIPVAEEPLTDPGHYGGDRVFAALLTPSERGGTTGERLNVLAAAGHPVIRLELEGPLDLGAEFYRWEFATAVAGAVLGVNPFDQPNVQESKDNTNRTLRQAQEHGGLPPLASDGRLSDLFAHARPGDYLAIMAYIAETPETGRLLTQLRETVLARTRLATTVGYGPRFLHSTGQLHKGGPASGLFLQLTANPSVDFPVPGAPYSFGTLAAAQAVGDLEALRAHHRRAVRVHLAGDIGEELSRLIHEAASLNLPGVS